MSVYRISKVATTFTVLFVNLKEILRVKIIFTYKENISYNRENLKKIRK